MKLKLDENGNVVMVDGKPVYVHDDGKEIPFDAAGTVATISRLNGEAKGHREAKEAAEANGRTLAEQMRVFEGLDPEAARKAINRAKDIDDGKLIESGRLDEVRSAAEKEYAARLTALQAEFGAKEGKLKAEKEALSGHLNNEIIGGSFARSKFIAENLAIPQDLVQAKFGNSFKVEDGKLVAVDASGNQIYSRARPGEAADFDEALGILVEGYANRDHILKSSGASGSGASASASRTSGNSKSITRAEFEALPPAAKSAHARAGNGIID
jgi:hypothetical protein